MAGKLSDEELRDELIELGQNPGPVTATTRSVYVAKLEKLWKERGISSGGIPGQPMKTANTRRQSRSTAKQGSPGRSTRASTGGTIVGQNLNSQNSSNVISAKSNQFDAGNKVIPGLANIQSVKKYTEHRSEHRSIEPYSPNLDQSPYSYDNGSPPAPRVSLFRASRGGRVSSGGSAAQSYSSNLENTSFGSSIQADIPDVVDRSANTSGSVFLSRPGGGAADLPNDSSMLSRIQRRLIGGEGPAVGLSGGRTAVPSRMMNQDDDDSDPDCRGSSWKTFSTSTPKESSRGITLPRPTFGLDRSLKDNRPNVDGYHQPSATSDRFGSTVTTMTTTSRMHNYPVQEDSNRPQNYFTGNTGFGGVLQRRQKPTAPFVSHTPSLFRRNDVQTSMWSSEPG